MEALAECLTLFGLVLKVGKSEIGTPNTFLGIAAYFPQPSNQIYLAISIPRDKAHRWARVIFEIIHSKYVSRATLESLIGRLSLAQAAVFGRFARAMLKPLYTKLYSRRYFPTLSPALERKLRRWAATLLSLTPRLATQTRTCPDWASYTYAAYEPGPAGAHIDALFYRITGGRWGRQVYFLLTSAPSTSAIAFFQTTATIFGLELAAAVLAVCFARHRLQGKEVTIHMDNNAALEALINGDSSDIDAYYLIATLRYLAAAFDIAIWFERVESARNIADHPTMNKPLPFPTLESDNFPHLAEPMAFYNVKIADRSISPDDTVKDTSPFTSPVFE